MIYLFIGGSKITIKKYALCIMLFFILLISSEVCFSVNDLNQSEVEIQYINFK